MPSDVVIDASVAAKWYLSDEPYLGQSERLRQMIEEDELSLVVTRFWIYELAGIFSKAAERGRLSDSLAQLSLQAAASLPREEVELPDPLDALNAARRFNRSVYDCFYLAIAEERGCLFWTDDRKLAHALGPNYPFVRWIGQYPDPAASPLA